MALRKCLRIAAAVLLPAIFAIVAMGCAKKPPQPVAVSGKVVRDGKGLVGMRVVFWPRDSNLRRIEAGTGAGGEFSLECPPGAYVVTVGPGSVHGPPLPNSGMPTTPESNRPNRTEKSTSVPDKYQDRQSSPLNVEVPAEGKKDLLLDLGK
ncbi:MAG TPA: hypothetical protein VKS79_21955 [Gemmataceae bacterium]|nr:hypothetical protein [Gemmataceae bacterium]